MEQARDSFEGQFVARIEDEFQIGGDVLDVRLFKKPDAAGDAEGNVLAGQFELQFQRVEMGAIEHGHVFQGPAFVAQFQDPLGHEGRLLAAIAATHQGRLAAGRARGGQLLLELVDVGRDGGIGHAQDFRRAAVIGFNPINGGLGIPFGKFEDVLEMRAAPGVNALRIVAHHHDVLMPRGQQIDQVALDFVGVLIFVHEDELEPALDIPREFRRCPAEV